MKFYALVILIIMLGFSTEAQDFEENINQTLTNYISELPVQTQFSVAVLNGEETHSYGIVKLENDTEAIDNSTSIFQIGSVTKVFTSTLLAQLVIEDQLELTDSIQEFFSFPMNENKITLEMLSNHTSGLPRLPSNLDLASVDPKNPYEYYTEADLEYYITKEMEVSSAETKVYEYSNLGAAILAKAIENATDKTYAELLSEKIFQVLEMEQSTLDENSVEGGFVKGLDPGGNEAPVWDMGVFEGAGALLSTAADLSKFVRAHFQEGENAFSLTTLPTFVVNPNLRLGLGWHILQDEQGYNLYWHNGGTGGYSASVFMVAESKKAIIILSNVSAYHPKASSIDELGFRLLNIF